MLAVLTPYYVKNVLDEGSGTLGLLWAASGTGAMLGALALIWWNEQARSARIWLATLLGPLSLLTMAITRDPALAIFATLVVSFAFSSQLGLIQTMIQESTPQQFRGRVMSLHGITFNGTMPIAGLGASALSVALGLPVVMAVAAVIFLVASVAVLQFAGGGITRVVAASREEFATIAAGG
jgi:hypothetical protein